MFVDVLYAYVCRLLRKLRGQSGLRSKRIQVLYVHMYVSKDLVYRTVQVYKKGTTCTSYSGNLKLPFQCKESEAGGRRVKLVGGE